MSSKKRSAFLRILLSGIFIMFTGVVMAAIPKNVLVIGQSHSNMKTMDPHVCYESPTGSFVMNLYTQLVHISYENDKFVIEPDTATSWNVAADGKTWTFNIRKGMRFANGDPLTAEDVVYSLKRVIKLKKSPSWLLTDTFGLSEEGIKMIDSYTVQIVTNGAPENVVLSNLANQVGSIVNKKLVEANDKDGDMGMDWLVDHSAGAGAYVLKAWNRNQAMIYTANKNYWKGPARLETIIFKDVPEAAERYLLLKKGDIDVAFKLTPEQLAEISKGNMARVVKTPGQSNEYVGMSANFGPFKNPKVRQAVKYAIDYNAMIDKVRGGYAINNQQFIAAGYFGYKENNPYSQDLAKARQLLKEAGYADGFDVELTTSVTERRRAEAVIVQQNLAQIGIRAKINIMQTAQMYAKFRKQGIDLIVAGWGNDYPDADALANPFANHRVKQLAWRLNWLDDKAADMAEAAAQEKDSARRAKIYQDLTNYWHENGPFAMLYQMVETWGVNNKVKGADDAFGGAYVHFDFYKLYK